jgi:hypothetical protein
MLGVASFWEYLCVIPFHVISLLLGIWVEY